MLYKLYDILTINLCFIHFVFNEDFVNVEQSEG